ncbi:MAG: efflux RND transporter permease subunit [Campylobacterota bacterium]|nr:efflux RND transporter permease subunit [Campylobacterota bacterium]
MSNDSFIERVLRRPYFIYSFLTLFLFLGVVGYNTINKKLFPDSNRPEVSVVIVNPGASAKTIAATVSVPIEQELYTIDKVRRVYSTTIDEVSVIRAEFEYSKDLGSASNDVSAALDKIRSVLPADIKEPILHKISAASAPILTLCVSSNNNQTSLEDIRLLAQNELKNKFLKAQGIANVDVFGGHAKELHVIVDKKSLDQYGMSIDMLIASLQKNDRDYAIGFISNEKDRYLLKSQGKHNSIGALKEIAITKDIRLGDIANIYFGHKENSALYYGNSKPAIALSLQRGINADVVKSIEAAENEIESFRTRYPNLTFEITDTQKDTIIQSTSNMFESLRDAIIMSTIVVFLFLASFRQVLVVLFTIPLVYASTIALMWIVGIEFNVVTLTAIILALGLLLDDTVVVLENIERHYKELGDKIERSVFSGTKEIMFADLSGTLTTMVALSPMLFVGDYPQTVFRPLVSTLLLALAASYVISITAVPLISLKVLAIKNPLILRAEKLFHKITGVFNDFSYKFFSDAVSAALNQKRYAILYFVVLAALFVVSVKGVMPTVGKELMPPMDTGSVKIKITTDPNLSLRQSEAVVQEANKIITDAGELLRLSSSIGSEAGVISIGSGGGTDNISILASYVNRYEREESIWDIQRALRQKLSQIENIQYLEVVDFGATALASIRANIDVTLYGANLNDLEHAADEVEKAMYKTQGLVSVSRTWNSNKSVYNLKIDEKMAAYYGLKNADVVQQLQMMIRGSLSASFELQNSVDFPIRLWIEEKDRDAIDVILELLIETKEGKIPLHAIAIMQKVKEPTLLTREGLEYTINVYGFREKAAITHIMESFEKVSKDLVLPPGVTMEQTGDIKQFNNSASRMVKAIGFAIILIFFTLIALFNSIKIPLMIIVSIPLTIIGGSWILLILDYHVSMPAMMGFILLSGIIVNNAILLIHFATEKMEQGLDAAEAMLQSIKIRTRPVLMTAFSVSAGMIPVALGWAIGLERLAPLGAVAIGGLIVGTFLTLLFIPLIFIWSEKRTTK